MQAWLHAFAFPGRVAELARWAETAGFDGLLVADSQNLNADVWVELALAGAATERIAVGPGVTNPATRHPAVTASAAATLQAETGGRTVLGMGRGDSALTQIGSRPVATADFERALTEVQGFLRGEDVPLGEATSRIAWLPDEHPKVPVCVAASGPHVIAAGARHAERVDFTVGAEVERLRWAAGAARAAGPAQVSLGAYVNLAVHPDAAVARDLVRGSVAILARFSAEGAPADGLSDVTRSGIERLEHGYDEARHGQTGAAHARELEDAFIDRFAMAGPAEHVLGRLEGIAELGIERVIVVAGSLDADPALVAETNENFVADVLPALARF